jgi:hypothetical protein
LLAVVPAEAMIGYEIDLRANPRCVTAMIRLTAEPGDNRRQSDAALGRQVLRLNLMFAASLFSTTFFWMEKHLSL